MLRSTLLIALLLLLPTGQVDAEIYRCRTPDGNMAMSDNPANLPQNCQPVDAPPDAGSFSLLPPAETATAAKPPTARPPEEKAEEEDEAPGPVMKEQAEEMVQRYDELVKRRYRGNLTLVKQRAAKEIAELKQEKRKMLQDLSASDLSSSEMREVRAILDKIPPE